jgi:hypothetical protein
VAWQTQVSSLSNLLPKHLNPVISRSTILDHYLPSKGRHHATTVQPEAVYRASCSSQTATCSREHISHAILKVQRAETAMNRISKVIVVHHAAAERVIHRLQLECILLRVLLGRSALGDAALGDSYTRKKLLAEQKSFRKEKKGLPSKEVAVFLGVFGLVGLLRVETTLSWVPLLTASFISLACFLTGRRRFSMVSYVVPKWLATLLTSIFVPLLALFAWM